jgi:hypothetical protein
MLTCFLAGGLGNQLFQIFTTIAYALTHKKSFVFTNKNQLDTKRFSYWQTFLAPLAKFTREINYNKLYLSTLREKEFAYNELHYIDSEEILLIGYFQSYKYFESHKQGIFRLIKLEEQRERIRVKYLSSHPGFSFNNSISLHFRRGDYKQLQEHYPLLTYDYYNKALKHIVSQKNLHTFISPLIFCEKNDINDIMPIIDQLKKSYPSLTFQIIDFNISDWEQLLLMSLCRDNIIANSSYSWWGAYFNMHPGKIVCYPNKWFGPKLQHNNMKDMCPITWTTF